MPAKFYAIKHKPTGNYLPQLRKKRGYTHTEPMSACDAVPRLHFTARGASLALYHWLLGRGHDSFSESLEGSEYDGVEYAKVPGRSREDMEIVPMSVREVPIAS